MSLKRFKVTYFYLATGMLEADEREYGEYVARTADEAKSQAIERHDGNLPKATQDFVRGCLTAEQVN